MMKVIGNTFGPDFGEVESQYYFQMSNRESEKDP